MSVFALECPITSILFKSKMGNFSRFKMHHETHDNEMNAVTA